MNFHVVRNGCAIAAMINMLSFGASSAPLDSAKIKSQRRIVYVDNVNECSDEWAKLLDEWESNGGGIRDSMWMARQQIEKDKKSRFAKIVRKIWETQKLRNFDGVAFGEWPIPDGAMMETVWKPSRNTGRYMSGILPHDCAELGALRPLFWDRMVIRSRHGKRACEPRYVEVPENLPWDPEPVSSWVIYWLFVRIDVPIRRVLVRTSPDMVCFENGRQWITPLER